MGFPVQVFSNSFVSRFRGLIATAAYSHPVTKFGRDPVNIDPGSLALRDVKINVPQAVIRGKDVRLECTFDLDGEKLYSVKWYRGEYEFFRYTPKDVQPIKIFPLKGIKVKRSESRDTMIVLENVSREISGPFSCEVTAEMPSFYTAMQTAELQVVDIPKSEPYITGHNKRYSLEDEIFQANCTSEYSYPAANITWYINGLQIRGPQVMKRTFIFDKYVTVVSSIRHRLARKFFPNGRMKLRCSASLYDVYHKSTEVSLELSDRSRKNQHPDWPPTTKAPPPSDEDYYEVEEYENTVEAPPQTTLWFWSPSSAVSSHLDISTLALLSLFVSRVLLR